MPRRGVAYTVRDSEGCLTSNVLSLTIHGEPRPQGRPRVVHQRRSPRSGKNNKPTTNKKSKSGAPPIKVYNPNTADQQSFKSAATTAIRAIYRGTLPLFGTKHPIHITISFYFKRPLSHFHSRICSAENLKEECRDAYPFSAGGDADNHLKFVLDALQEIVYENDRQVINITVQKNYSNTSDERTEILCIADGYEPIVVLY